MILNLVWFLPRPIPAAGTTRVALGTETAQYACWETGFAVGNTSGAQGLHNCVLRASHGELCQFHAGPRITIVLGCGVPPCFGGGKLVFIAV